MIDGDIPAYRAAYLVEGEGGDAMDAAELARSIIRTWADQAHCSRIIVGLSGRRGESFRRELNPDYKNHREGKEHPALLAATKQAIDETFKVVRQPMLEADDVLGILATNGRVESPIVVTIDKDLLQIPAWHFNPDKDDFPHKIGREEADYYFFKQWLTGDSTDNFFGVPKCEAFKRGVGPKTADKILDDPEDRLQAVLDAYEAAEMTEEYCILQARMAKILRASDWDATKKEPILWEPQFPV